MAEFAQTYFERFTKHQGSQALTPPEGEGWELHSWQLDLSVNSQYIAAIWRREKQSK